jgi:hypothetical protein
MRCPILGVMNAFHATVATALRLAGRPDGETAAQLAELARCHERSARRTLALLARDGILVAEVPERKGQRRGEWANVYRVPPEGGAREGA